MSAVPRTLRQYGLVAFLIALLAVASYGVFITRPAPKAPSADSTGRRARPGFNVSTDQGTLDAVEQLLRLPTRLEERSYAQSALRLASVDADLAFVQSVRLAAARARATPESKQLDTRLAQARKALAADSDAIVRLKKVIAAAKPADAAAVNDRLQLAQAMAALDAEEVADAHNDLVRAGGDPQARTQAMIAEHQTASKSTDSLKVVITPATDAKGLFNRVTAWQSLGDKRELLVTARGHADSAAALFKSRHDMLEARGTNRYRDTLVKALSHDSASALVAATQLETLAQKALTTLDERIDVQHQLADIYGNWTGVIDTQRRAAMNGILRSVVALLTIVLVVVLLSRWVEQVTKRLSIDRRRAQTLHMVTRVGLQVLGVLLILLVVFGPPNNLGTFLGLAGAGLTVALQDFILGFIGWFMLMGRDGIRIGDLVEINGVTGEVVELGMFHTVLLETGDWSASGHPTGRRVTFANKFAIEGHYFNFSTSGQWVWDEVEFLVPDGRDPYAVAESLRTEVDEATKESAQQAESEWKGSRRGAHSTVLNVAPAVSLRPVPGGSELRVRYVTRMSERAEVRGRLYALAMKALAIVP